MSGHLVKKAHLKTKYTPVQIKILKQSSQDPVFFIENFCKLIDSKTGKEILFKLFPYQLELINSVQDNRNSVCLWARQIGKCLFFTEKINKDGEEIEIGKLIWNNLGFRSKLVIKLEILKIRLLLWLHEDV